MNYIKVTKFDTANGPGIRTVLWVSGCNHHCKGCHNPQTWDYNGGQKLPPDFKEQILAALNKNGVKRNLSILGGEPMCEQNIELVHALLSFIKFKLPGTKELWKRNLLLGY